MNPGDVSGRDAIIQAFKDVILNEGKVVVLNSQIFSGPDQDKPCLSMLFKSGTDNIGHQFEDDYCERAYPTPEYTVVSVMSPAAAMGLLSHSKKQKDQAALERKQQAEGGSDE